MDPDEKGMENFHTPNYLRGVERGYVTRAQHPEIFSGSRAPTLSLISRPGLFKLIQRSNKPEAEKGVRNGTVPAPNNEWLCVGI